MKAFRDAVSALHCTGEPTVQTAGKLPEADICFLDEIFKCNDGMLNSLLTALNERKYTNEGHTYAIPTISFFAASNEIPNFNDPQEKILAALYDRLELKVVTADISGRDKRLAVLHNKQAGPTAGKNADFTLDELGDMQTEAAAIPLSDAINELMDDILCELRKSVTVSDRKYLNFYPIAQAKAWLLAHVRANPNLKAIARYLGRFREIFAEGKRNGYAYGRGEKYSIELGNTLSRALTSELAMLASPLMTPLFLRKYQRKQLKQYQRREPIHKGMGDVIVCLDESLSTAGDNAAWGKAVALTLLDIAADSKRSFALIHFSGHGSFRTDIFRPGSYSAKDKMDAAECFLSGGTDFETPLKEAVRLMGEDGFENADVVFITDGNCELPEAFSEQLRAAQAENGFSVTGVLLDAGSLGWEFSLKSFCQKVYRTSELMGEEIVQSLVSDRV